MTKNQQLAVPVYCPHCEALMPIASHRGDTMLRAHVKAVHGWEMKIHCMMPQQPVEEEMDES